MKPIYLKPGQTVAVVPMKEEPQDHHWSSLKSYKMKLITMNTSKGPYLKVLHTIAENPHPDKDRPWIRFPYRPGEKCYVKEAWCKSIVEGIIYKDGYDVPDAPRWRSPVTMPAKYARRFVTILSCEPIRVREIIWQDAIKTGIEVKYCCNGADCSCMGLPIDNPVDDFLDKWHQRHPDHEWAWLVRTEG